MPSSKFKEGLDLISKHSSKDELSCYQCLITLSIAREALEVSCGLNSKVCSYLESQS